MIEQPISSANFTLSFPDSETELSIFTGLSGLSLWMEGDELYEGGVNDSPYYLPTRIRYKPFIVSRPVSSRTARTCKWVIDSLNNPKPRTGKITLRDAAGKPISEIELLRLHPVAWRGPELDTSAPQTAMEQIEFVHGGFTFPPISPGGQKP
ncbi:phage tail protein [Streptomyces sp. 5.8]|uniref:phage tail protein n=1 Tax=Streptomyces sp. 5.8 TaxID=3406571 RepID=UPI003BB7DEAC